MEDNKEMWKNMALCDKQKSLKDKFETEIWSIKCECVGMKFLECEAVNILFHQI